VSKLSSIVRREYFATVRTKAFLIALVLIPGLMIVSVLMPFIAERYAGPSERRCAIVDDTGGLMFAAITRAAEEEIGAPSPFGFGRAAPDGKRHFERIERAPGQSAEALGLELSERVRSGELFCFVEIDATVLAENANDVRYFTQTPTDIGLPLWLGEQIEREVHRQRLAKLGLDPNLVERAEAPVSVVSQELYTGGPGGSIQSEGARDPARDIVFPLGASLLLYMVLMLTAGPLMQSVLEEKMNRVAEILVSSVPPFKLLLGKLIAASAVAFTLLGSYAIGGVLIASELGVTSALGPQHWFWAIVFLLLALAMYGSIFLAVGSACNDVKESQTLMMPVMLVMMLPLLLLHVVLTDPNGPLSTALSLIPFFSPTLMILRFTLEPGAPLWQMVLAALLTALTAYGCIRGAGRIFRIGMLDQGGARSLRELWRWSRQR
jgi:ABC-2 type transport system permease protein